MASDSTRVVRVEGPAIVSYAASSASLISSVPAGTEIGTCRNGVVISIRNMIHGVSNDEWGGPEGVPVEKLFMGATASIRCEFSKYINNNMKIVRVGSGGSGTDEGTILLPGTPLYANYAKCIIITGRYDSYAFPMCVMNEEPVQFNISATESIVVASFTATSIVTASGSQLYYKGSGSAVTVTAPTENYGGSVPKAT